MSQKKMFIDKWIYKTKKNVNEQIIKYKTRWYIRNFEQMKKLNLLRTRKRRLFVVQTLYVLNDKNVELNTDLSNFN